MAMIISCENFENNKNIPVEFSCEGGDNIPTLNIQGLPENTKSIVLICDDPDAPMDEPFVHWVLWKNDIEEYEININKENINKFQEGLNTSGNNGWMGPCPPVGHGVHHYYFKLYAVSENVNVSAGASKDDILEDIEGKVIEQNYIVGLYER